MDGGGRKNAGSVFENGRHRGSGICVGASGWRSVPGASFYCCWFSAGFDYVVDLSIILIKSTLIPNMSMKTTSIADALFSTVQQRLLAICFGNPERSFYTNQLIRLIGAGSAPVQRELKRMSAADLLTVSSVGNQKHYRANMQSPVFAELSALIRKTFGLADVVRHALLPVADQLKVALIYGSIAKGQEHASSDVDLLLITDTLGYADLFALLTEAEAQLGRPINPSLYTAAEWRHRLESGNTFALRLLEQPKIFLIGSENDLGKSS